MKKASIDDVIADFSKLSSEDRQAFKRALKTFVEDTIGPESQDECPVETGALRRSWEVDDPVESTNGVFITFGYNTDYAIYVHENLEAHHAEGKKAKFLEDPLNRHIDDIGKELLDRIDRILGVKI